MKTSLASTSAMRATDLARAIAAGELTAVEAVDAHIARIEEVNPRLNAVVVPLFDDARSRAAAADRAPRSERGPLHGLPVTVKECFDVAGTPSTAGLTSRSSHRAEEDAPLVARLRGAGAIILGKTNLSQLLLYVESDNPVYGRTNSPLDAERSPGGSSGGEAAIVAAGGSAFGIGTDVGGSVRVPAHCCGIQGFKPTPGRLSVAGTVRMVGPACAAAIPDSGGLLARSVADLGFALDALSPRPPGARSVRDIRIGFYEDDGSFPASPALRRAVREAAARLADHGCKVVTFTPPPTPEALAIFYGFFGADGGDTWREQLGEGAIDPRVADLLTLASMPNAVRPLAAGALRIQGQPTLARTVAMTGRASESRVAELMRRRDAYRERFAAAMRAAGIDALLCPPSPVPAYRHGTTREMGPASVSYTSLFNLLGYPAGVVTTTAVREEETTARAPSREKMRAVAGEIDRGSARLPIGVQIAAMPDRDDDVLTVMEALEPGSR